MMRENSFQFPVFSLDEKLSSESENSKLKTENCLMKHTITLIPGDGIGPEVTSAVVRIIEAAGVEVAWETHYAGAQALEKFGTTLPDDLLESIKRNRVALKGPITTPVGKGFTSVNVGLRKALDLYANLRPVRALPNVPSRYPELDLVVVRENTEDLYSGIEHVVVPGVVESIKIITAKASTRVAKFAFEYARREGRKKVTAVHKANIMKLSDGLFLECFRTVSNDFPEIEADDKIVDNACMQLVMRPEQFDVMLLENLYGDIVSDLCAGLIGGLGLVPGANIGEQGAVFEAVHGSAPDIAGQGVANPTALLQSGILMLRHLNERDAAERIEQAMLKVFREGKVRTRDIGGTAKTMEFAEAIMAAM
jgi:isocitrate dehydrogenase (NAD+)